MVYDDTVTFAKLWLINQNLTRSKNDNITFSSKTAKIG